MYLYSFERLEVWKQTKDLCVFVYNLTRKFPKEESFGLVSQIRRSAISIASNIAEGSGRISLKDKSHFYTMAYSSAMELLNQLIISNELRYISEEESNEARKKLELITKGISGLRYSTLNPKP